MESISLKRENISSIIDTRNSFMVANSRLLYKINKLELRFIDIFSCYSGMNIALY